MARGRKLHAHSFAARLSPDQRDELMDGLSRGSLSLADAAEKAGAWAGRKVSETAVSNWWRLHRMDWQLGQAKQAAERAMAEAPEDLDEAARRAIGYQRMVAVYGELSPREVVLFERNELARRKLEHEEQRLQIDRRKLELLERKAEQADAAAGTLEDDRLNDAEKAQKIRQIFGM